MERLYDDPAVYDILHTPGTAREIDVLEFIEATCGRPGGRWYEPACGTGRYLRAAAGRGRRVGGYDLDPDMVAYARRRLGRRVRTASMTDPVLPGVGPGSIGFAFNPVNTVRHLPDDRALRAHFAQVAHLLAAPDGVYAVGISLSDYARDVPDEDLWEAARGPCRVSQLVNYLPPEPGSRAEMVISHLMVTRPSGVEHRDDSYALRTYDEAQWRRVLGGSALRRVASLDAFGRPLGGPGAAYQWEVLGLREQA